ncbi:MAG: SDR family oxidoreductase [Candidatus Lernaella stagnicola]|nr:SDR family oxidoreductase [Candidatus Lernaella stagnicola]
MSKIRLDSKVAIITGAGRGLGRSHALLLGSRGAKVVVNDLGGGWRGEKDGSSAPADDVVAEIKAAGGEAVANYDNVLDGAKIVETAMDAFGRIDIVVNNAGILRDVSFHKMTDDDWNLVYEVHVRGSYMVTKAAWPHLRDQQYGRIIMTTSAAGLYGNFGQANYSMAKMGLVGLGLTLAHEGQKRNVLVNIIAPIAGSRMTETVLPPELVEKLKPEYVSPLVAFLCSEQNQSTGGIYEVGAGVIGRVKWMRAPGAAIPLKDGVSIEDVAAHWDKINDMTDGKFVSSLQESSMMTMQNLASAE